MRAGAAIALLRLGSDDAVPFVLDVEEDPDPLTQFVHGIKVRGVEPTDLLNCWKDYQDRLHCLEQHASSSVLYGLLLALGEFDLEHYPQEERQDLVDQVSNLYAGHWSSGVHGAAGWLLRRWGKEQEAQEIDQRPVDYEEGHEWFTMAIHAARVRDGQTKESTFYMTFVVFEPGVYQIGSRVREVGHEFLERRLTVLIPRRFAVLDRELSVREIRHWSDVSAGFGYPREPETIAYGGMYWYGAVRYCRWLTAQMEGKTERDQAYPDESILAPSVYARDTAPGANGCLLYTSPSPRDRQKSRMPSSA
jgi:hypothetical protein